MWSGIRQAVGQGRRREQARQVVAHRARRRDRRQVRRPLHPPFAGHRAGDRDQRQRRGDQHEGPAERQRQRLPALAARTPRHPHAEPTISTKSHARTLTGASASVARSNEQFSDRTRAGLRGPNLFGRAAVDRSSQRRPEERYATAAPSQPVARVPDPGSPSCSRPWARRSASAAPARQPPPARPPSASSSRPKTQPWAGQSSPTRRATPSTASASRRTASSSAPARASPTGTRWSCRPG